ncbi:hypothetical protein M0R45_005355 [Rubus argutus]|uniref:RNA-polymerase II-associated protein 3-like C-terminal domain-containing protein n=1 Tax=Rubus argutus TaxID=59490 RepID=A0AAW1YMM1_RUBAR
MNLRLLGEDSGDRALQAKLLKAISPSALPQIFKNASTVGILVVCDNLFLGNDEMDLAVNILENLTEVPRFDTLIMFLSSTDKADLAKIWDEVFYNDATPLSLLKSLITCVQSSALSDDELHCKTDNSSHQVFALTLPAL